jgi:uncharacterized protein
MAKTINTQADPSRIAAISNSNVPEKLQALIAEAHHLAVGRKSFEEKADGMVTFAERISNLVTPYTPCVKGCNHCCYMAVAVSSYEADMIGRYLGRDKNEAAAVPLHKYADPKARDKSVEDFTGVPCTLLGADGKCTVYPVRPIACRNHHNLGKDETNCVIVTDKSKGLPTTPSINIDAFLVSHAMVFYEGNQSFADLREWFPKKEA